MDVLHPSEIRSCVAGSSGQQKARKARRPGRGGTTGVGTAWASPYRIGTPLHQDGPKMGLLA
jgi:hypothetical protein